MSDASPTQAWQARQALTIALAWLLVPLTALAQEPMPLRMIEGPGGLRIFVDAKTGSDEELALRLEEAARRLREGKRQEDSPEKTEKGAAKGPGRLIVRDEPVSADDRPVTAAALAPLGTPPPAVAVEEARWEDRAPGLRSALTPGWQCLPTTVLFAPPIANPNEPRMYAKATSLDNENTRNTNDTALGALVPIVRYTHCDADRNAWQVDFFGVVFSRWRSARDSIGVDYRIGVPLTRAVGPWEFKLAYEHTSTHLGDEFVRDTGRQYLAHVRDEIVFGAAYRFLDVFRAYGQIAYAFNLQTAGPENHGRYDLGLEWSSPAATGWRGQPYAAVDLEFRGDQNLYGNFTSQLGWQWRAQDDGANLRLGLEYFNGRSPYGQFFLDRESWIGVGIFYGF